MCVGESDGNKNYHDCKKRKKKVPLLTNDIIIHAENYMGSTDDLLKLMEN
jgi:hypothetical protein